MSDVAPHCGGRVRTDGKHLVLDGSPWRVRGVTYGSFVPRLDGELFPEQSQLKQDMVDIVAAGFNTVRTYTVPSVDLLEVTEELGLRVLAGIDYRDWRYEAVVGRRTRRQVADAGARAIDQAMERLAGRANVLGVSVGNEVPVDVVRLHGIAHVERGLSGLVERVHAADPDLLVTYSNFPTTEFLAVEGLDFDSFNVFLEQPGQLGPYLRHLQVVSDGRPLVITELGLASSVHGEDGQAASLEWQLRLVDEAGCAGATVFAWTDEWGVNGQAVEGWGFGLTTADRRPKPALGVASNWARFRLCDLRAEWPRVSVVVCAYNEDRRIRRCLESLALLDYPEFEVLVCDDGSTDGTADIARQFPFRVLQLPHGGLSRARNAGIEAATGEVVAFLDADAQCHPEWLHHLVLAFDAPRVVGVGGPNLPVVGAGLVERAVAASPGNPTHVLIGDDRAEHVPGCNMAFRREALIEIGCFDATYTTAGDDVDVCWKLLDRGDEIAFAPAAQVRHHRRDSVRGYLRQQRGYGRSERMVAARHPHRFNRLGQARWRGFIYGGGRVLPSLLRPVVYHGYHGMAPYQGVSYRPAESTLAWVSALLPLFVPLAALGALFGALWTPSFVIMGSIVLLITVVLASVTVGARPGRHEDHPYRYRLLVGGLHLAQPMVRTWGRLERVRCPAKLPCRPVQWTGDRASWIAALAEALRTRRCAVVPGDPHDSWDLETWVGPFIGWRLTTAILWKWQPAARGRLTIRPAAYPPILAASALAVFSWSLAAAIAGTELALVVLEVLLLSHRITRSLRLTTAGVEEPERPFAGAADLRPLDTAQQ